MHISLSIAVLFSAAALVASQCIYLPAPYKKGFPVPFTLEARAQGSKTGVPLNLVNVVPSKNRTWQVLTTQTDANDASTQFSLKNSTITAISTQPPVMKVQSVGALFPPHSSVTTINGTTVNGTTTIINAGPGPWLFFSETPTTGTSESKFCATQKGSPLLLSWADKTTFFLCTSHFGNVTLDALTYETAFPLNGVNGTASLNGTSCREARVIVHPVADTKPGLPPKLN